MSPFSPKIMIVAGEASGDLHAASLVREIRCRAAAAEFFGIGGDRMRNAGTELLYHIDQMSVLGFTEVIRHLPFMHRVMDDLTRTIRERRPDLLILVDYPGFNLRLARRARKFPAKVMYYIAPQVWAWGARRAQQMAKWIDRLAVVFQFEEEIFRSAGVDAHFVGHPLLEGLEVRSSREAFLAELGIEANAPLLGLLPGSRVQEVKRLLPEMIRTWHILRQQLPDLRAVVARAPGVPEEIYRSQAPDDNLILVPDRTYEVMRHSTALIVASGTATLEAACLGTPFVVVYKVSRLSYHIGKRLVSIPDIGLVNVVAGRRIVPEFIQQNFRAEELAPVLLRLITDNTARQKMMADLRGVRSRLGEPGASRRTAELALTLLEATTPVQPKQAATPT
jgi:lipid-A-disaccharide synthase